MLKFDREGAMPIFLQLANGIIQEISNGRIPRGSKLPSSRKLAASLKVNRQTIVRTYQELELQGWVETKQTKGTFIIEKLPIQRPKPIAVSTNQKDDSLQVSINSRLIPIQYQFDDGSPDVRLAPLQQLAKTYSSLLKTPHFVKKNLDYQQEFRGDLKLRIALCQHLSDTRAIRVNPDQVLITRGSIMAFYLYLSNLLEKDRIIAVGKPGYLTFNKLVNKLKGKIIEIPIDENGINTEALDQICQRTQIPLVYIISHHHHPTTVTLSPERRIHLLQLSEKYGFQILEDDYDYDFHYDCSPILPLASWNHNGNVMYIGSFSKTIAPSLRLGFLIGPESIVQELGELRRFIDRSGDPVLERAVSILLKEGEIRRHLNKALLAYRKRRDLLCYRLNNELKDYIQCKKPSGGMALWATFDQSISLNHLAENCKSAGLYIGNNQNYLTTTGNSTRLGFASMDELEINAAVDILIGQVKK